MERELQIVFVEHPYKLLSLNTIRNIAPSMKDPIAYSIRRLCSSAHEASLQHCRRFANHVANEMAHEACMSKETVFLNAVLDSYAKLYQMIW